MIERRRFRPLPDTSTFQAALCAILFVVLLFAAPFLSADEYRPELTIQAPTAYVSGAPLTVAELSEYRLYCDGAQVASITPVAAVTTWQAGPREFAPGSYSCHATALDLAGDESGPSNTVGFTVSADRPAPPALNIVAGGGAG